MQGLAGLRPMLMPAQAQEEGGGCALAQVLAVMTTAALLRCPGPVFLGVFHTKRVGGYLPLVTSSSSSLHIVKMNREEVSGLWLHAGIRIGVVLGIVHLFGLQVFCAQVVDMATEQWQRFFR